MSYPTRYEIVAVGGQPNAPRYHVGFAVQTTRRGLLAAMQAVGPALIEVLAIGDDDELTFRRNVAGMWAAELANGGRIEFTGATELSVRTEGAQALSLPQLAATAS
jgi:hypothetical protein